MAYRSVTHERLISASPERIWPLLADPRLEIGGHPVTVEPDREFRGVVGESWVEVHGADCDHDRVPCVVVTADHPRLLRTVARQRGIKQTIEYRLIPEGEGTRVVERLVFAPSLAGRPGQQILPWLLLVTGLLARLSAEEDETFDKLELLTAAPE